MKTRDEAFERALDDGLKASMVDESPRAAFKAAVYASLRAEGWQLAPVEATPEMLAAALPIVGSASEHAKKIGAAACLLLSCGRSIACEGDAVTAAADLFEDYRAMLAAAEKE